MKNIVFLTSCEGCGVVFLQTDRGLVLGVGKTETGKRQENQYIPAQRSPGTNIVLAAREHSVTFVLIRKLVLRPKPNVFSVHKFFLGHPYLRADLIWKSGTVASGEFGGLGWMQLERQWNLLVFWVEGWKKTTFSEIQKIVFRPFKSLISRQLTRE